MPLMSAQDNKQLVAAAFEAWANGTGNVFDLLRDDVRWTITGTCALAGTYTSKAQFLTDGLAPLAARLSRPITPTVRSIIADGDWVVVLWDGQAGTVDGQPYDNTYSWHLRVDDGMVVEVIAFFDGQMLDSLFDRVPGPS
jgi:ketosteroid isomerase-like protein